MSYFPNQRRSIYLRETNNDAKLLTKPVTNRVIQAEFINHYDVILNEYVDWLRQYIKVNDRGTIFLPSFGSFFGYTYD